MSSFVFSTLLMTMTRLLLAEELRSTAHGKWMLSRVVDEGKNRLLAAYRHLSLSAFEEKLEMLNEKGIDVIVTIMYVIEFGGLIKVKAFPMDGYYKAYDLTVAEWGVSLEDRILITVQGLCIRSAPEDIQQEWLNLEEYQQIHSRVEVYPDSLHLNNVEAERTRKVCFVCGEAQTQLCSFCKSARYCNAVCQRKAYDSHEPLCKWIGKHRFEKTNLS